jgi:hypothetical protein
MVWAIAPGLLAQDKKPEWKDRGEYELYDSAVKDPTALSRLATIDKWKSQYPQTDFNDVRQDMYLITLRQLTRSRDAFNAAIDILSTRPENLVALSTIVINVNLFTPPSANDLEVAEKAINQLLNNLDKLYAPANKPTDTKETDWAKAKPEMKAYAQKTLAYICLNRKDNDRLEKEATKALELDPSQGQVSYWLATAILSQTKDKPEKYPLGLYHCARAISVDGPGSLTPPDKQKVREFLATAYAKYHGSPEGLETLIAAAKANALPGPEWAGIKSATEIAKEKQAKDDADALANPMLALWRNIKHELTGPNGQEYFDSGMKGALLPGNVVKEVTKFKGKLIQMTPATKPKELVLGIEHGDMADVTLKLDGALPGKMEAGGDIEFEGVAVAFTKEPFMVTFDVEKSKIVGWTGKNTPAPAPKKPGSAGKKKAG